MALGQLVPCNNTGEIAGQPKEYIDPLGDIT